MSAGASPTWERVSDLALTIDSYSLERLDSQVSSGFVRAATIIVLAGAGEEGRGEVSAVREVAVERRLADAGPPCHFAHRDVRTVSKQLPGGDEDRLVVALGVFPPRRRNCDRHDPSLGADSVIRNWVSCSRSRATSVSGCCTT